MIILSRNLFRWVLVGGAFVAVVAAAGCSGGPHNNSGSTLPSADARQAPTVIDAQPAKPPTINVFGEFDGMDVAGGKPVGITNFQQNTFLDEGADSDPAVDPTGKWLVFASTRDSEHANIYLQRVDGVSVTQLTNDESEHAFPAFSPDGKQIAFCSTRSGNWDIYVMDLDGRNVMQITSGPMQDVHPSFSPDGTKLVYSTLGGKSGQWELWTVDLVTNEKKMIGFGLFPSWSPSKSCDRIAFQRARERGSRRFSLWTLDLVDGEARRVTEVAVSPTAAIVSPTWSPDGSKLGFATITEPRGLPGVKPKGQQDIWTVNADGTNRHRLTNGTGSNLSPCWGADNRIFFVSDRGGCECVWSVLVDGPKTATAAASSDKAAAKDAAKKDDSAKPSAVGSADVQENQ